MSTFLYSLKLNTNSLRLYFFTGLFLAAYSIIFGVETAKGFRQLLENKITHLGGGISGSSNSWRVDTCERHCAVIVLLIMILGLLWCVSGILGRKEFSSGGSEAQLWLACIIGPPGVWIRWFLARLNGRGLGRKGFLKWIPFGTLIANVSAACVMAALATVKKAVCFYDVLSCRSITPWLCLCFYFVHIHLI